MCHICEDFAHSMWEECVTNEQLRFNMQQFLIRQGFSKEHFRKSLMMIYKRESRVGYGA